MGIWYFLLLFIGLFLIIKGLYRNKSTFQKVGFITIGLLFVSFSIFMFTPGSAETMIKLLDLE